MAYRSSVGNREGVMKGKYICPLCGMTEVRIYTDPTRDGATIAFCRGCEHTWEFVKEYDSLKKKQVTVCSDGNFTYELLPVAQKR